MIRALLGMLLGGALTASLVACGAAPADAPTSPTSAPAQASSGAVSPAPAAIGELVPTQIDYTAIGARSSLEPEGLNPDGTMATPDVKTPEQAGWYDKSPVPGEQGPSIVMGHINGGGRPGVFNRLSTAQTGDMLAIKRSDGKTASFRVTQVTVVPKDAFPTSRVYSDTTRPELRLISCGGALDRSARSYTSNVVVYAELVSLT